MFRFSIVLLLTVSGCYAEELKAEARDSYLDAYQQSHGPSPNVVSYNDRESKYTPLYESSAPDQLYGPPHPGYPEPSYPPAHYGPPVYGPPDHDPRYRAFPAPFSGVPHALMGFFDKLRLKLDIFTILKIILKLVIFKKIVKFLALICLLLFIPKFKSAKDEDEMDELDSRTFKNGKSQANSRLNTLTEYVLSAIEKYSGNKNSTNKERNNAAKTMIKKIDNKFSYQRLLNMYADEES